MTMKKSAQIDIISKASLLFSIALYLFFAFYDGYFTFNDSDTYINMDFAREPIYPLLLAFFRTLVGSNYLLAVVIFQSLLTAFAGWKIADYVRRYLEIHPIYSLILYVIPIGVSLLNRFVAKRGSMYSNSIVSEGIAIPLFLLFAYFLLKYLFEEKKSSLIGMGFLSFILISTRKQMIITLILLVIVVLWKNISNKKFKNGIVKILICSVTILCMVRLLDCSYNYLIRGEFVSHSSDNRFLTTMIFYNAEEQDADYIEDENVRDLFLKIYDACDEKGYTGSHAEEGWMNRVAHFGDNYDFIQINTMWPMITEQAKINVQTGDSVAYEKETDRINSVIIWSVLPHQIPELLKSFIDNFLSGLVTTVAQCTPILNVYSCIIYFVYIILFIRLLNNIIKKRMDERVKHTLELAAVSAVAIVINVALVSVVIFCQTRYTIYNMPLFYMSGAVLLYYNVMMNKLS